MTYIKTVVDFYGFQLPEAEVSRYDGYEFVNYNPNTPHCKLKSNFIINVCEDSFQRLWMVSEGGTDIIDLTNLKPTLPGDAKGY